MDQRYSNTQRIGFAGIIIAFLLCIAGAIAPYWRKGEINVNLDLISNILDKDVKLVEFHGGLFYYCVQPIIGDKECHVYDTDNIKGQEAVMYILLLVQIFLSMMCGCCALCRMCCCGGGKTVCHGIMAFLAGAAGVGVVAIYYNTSEDSWGMKLKIMDYGWALAIYAIGAGILVVVSFMLCFASPDNPITGMILSHAPAGIQVNTSASYARFDNPQMAPGAGQQMYPGPPQPMYPAPPQAMHPVAAENPY